MDLELYRACYRVEERQSWVYFIGDGRRVKIGTAIDPYTRMLDLQCGSPYELELYAVMAGGRSEEAKLHRQFNADWRHGEWFDLGPHIREFINANCYTWGYEV
jgi:T5orf172 domain